MDAQRARGYELDKIEGGLIQQVRKLGPIIVPVTIHAIISSEDIIDAMDLRAFGTGPRTWLEELHYQNKDLILIGLAILLLITALVILFIGYGQFWVPSSLLEKYPIL
jgi:energy-coupling factor transport system permease protein